MRTNPTSGKVTITDAAMIVPRGISNWLAHESSAIVTGTVRVRFEDVKVSANRNSFQAAMKASSPVVTSAGHIRGMKTRVTMIHADAPSTIAASSISTGSSRMNVVSTHTVNGRVKIMYEKIRPQMELNRPKNRITSKKPASTAI